MFSSQTRASAEFLDPIRLGRYGMKTVKVKW